MRAKFSGNLLNLNESRSRRGPAEQYRTPCRKARKLPQQGTEAIRHQAFHQILITFVDKPV